MPANSNSAYPRSWFVSQNLVSGAALSFGIAPPAGIAAVIDTVIAQLVCTANATFAPYFTIVNTTTNIQLLRSQAICTYNTSAQLEFDGLDLLIPSGQVATFSWSAGLTNVSQFIHVQGHDL